MGDLNGFTKLFILGAIIGWLYRNWLNIAALAAVIGFAVAMAWNDIKSVPPDPDEQYEQCRAEYLRKSHCLEDLPIEDCLSLIENQCGRPK